MKVSLMGDNGFRAGQVSPQAAGAPARAAADVFGTVSDLGFKVDRFGDRLQAQEDALWDDEKYRMGVNQARQLLSKAEAEVDAGKSWEEALSRFKDGTKEPEFRNSETVVRYRAAIDDMVTRGGDSLKARYQAGVAKRAQAAFNADYANAMASGDLNHVESVIKSGEGIYITPKKVQSLMESSKKKLVLHQAVNDAQNNPGQLLSDLYAGTYKGFLSEAQLSQLEDMVGGFSAPMLSLNEITEVPSGENAQEDFQAGLIADASGGVGKKSGGAKKMTPGLVGSAGDCVRVSLYETGKMPGMEQLCTVMMQEVLAYDMAAIVSSGGVGGAQYALSLAKLKASWDEYHIPKGFQDSLVTVFNNRVKVLETGSGDRFNVDFNSLLETLSKGESLVTSHTLNNLKFYKFNPEAEEAAEAHGGIKLQLYEWEKKSADERAMNEAALKAWHVGWLALHPDEKNSMNYFTALRDKVEKLTGRRCTILDLMHRSRMTEQEEYSREMESDLSRQAVNRKKLDELAQAAASIPVPAKGRGLRLSSEQVNVGVADYSDPEVKKHWHDNAFIIGEEILRQFPDLAEQYLPDLALRLNKDSRFRPGKLIIVPGRAFGLTAGAAMQLHLAPGKKLKCKLEFDFPTDELAQKKKVKKLFSAGGVKK